MQTLAKWILWFAILFLNIENLSAQPLYTMQNALVKDCEGILEDSNEGPEEGQYNHNENYIFTICVENASELLILFEYFSTELNFDQLWIYDGPNTSSPLIAQLSGIVIPPPSYIAYSGCVTFHFISDENIAAKGWRLRWSTRIESLPSPSMTLVGETQCPLENLYLSFPDSILCELLKASHFTIIGPENVVIESLEVLDCEEATQNASLVHLLLSQPLREKGLYRIYFTAQTLDVCGDPLTLETQISFTLMPCPLEVVIDGPSSICLGECATWTVEASNGSGSYQYFWNFEPGGSTQEFCLNSSQWITLVVVDSENNLTDTTEFFIEVEICPLKIQLLTLIPSCPGGCGSASIGISGGTNSISIHWSHNEANNASTSICMDTTTIIHVRVIDEVVGDTLQLTFDYIPAEFPVFLNPLAQDTICSSAPDHFYEVSIGGGSFFSSNIPGNQRKTGRYSFWRWADKNTWNTDVVEYRLDNGCAIRDTFTVVSVYAGRDLITCLDTDSLLLVGMTPLGGEWSGPGVVSEGVFRPFEAGDFILTYSADWGCEDRRKITIVDEIALVIPDTLCSNERITLAVNVEGGKWFGTGIVDQDKGILEGWRPAPNQWHTYRYELTGCYAETELYVQGIPQGTKTLQCASDSLFILPFEGNWTGPGIFYDSLMAYDVQNLGEGVFTYILSLGKCNSAFELQRKNIALQKIKEPFFCYVDNNITLSQYLQPDPPGGIFSGPGVGPTGNDFFLNPWESGSGTFVIYYEVLGCVDSIAVLVDTPAVIPPYIFCERSKPLQLVASPPGGTWQGNGFLNTSSGWLDPQLLDFGTHDILYTAPNGCPTSAQLFKEWLQPAEILGLQPFYCFNNDTLTLEFHPQGGEIKIKGELAYPLPSISSMGPGIHEIEYSHGSGDCISTTRRFISVLPPIGPTSKPLGDSICPNNLVRLEVLGDGGNGLLTYEWEEPLGFGNSHSVYPDSSQWYVYTISDQCSEPYVDSVYILVYPPLEFTMEEGPEVCFGEESFVSIRINSHPDAEIIFQDRLYFSEDSLRGPAGFYTVDLMDVVHGCHQKLSIKIPGAPYLAADFSMYPNQPCIDLLNNRIEIINLSTGYDSIYLNFGDGSPWRVFGSDFQEILDHNYDAPGVYDIVMIAEQSLGCTDTLSLTLCVENIVKFFIPNAFSPNGDGSNDALTLYGMGIEERVTWQVYDRWGQMVFLANSIHDSWDGTLNGKPLNPGVYVLVAKYIELETGNEKIVTQDVTLIR
jgi:gliding motility-associated-like protein